MEMETEPAMQVETKSADVGPVVESVVDQEQAARDSVLGAFQAVGVFLSEDHAIREVRCTYSLIGHTKSTRLLDT